MNESGKSVAAAVKKFSSSPKDILVVHDDSDIPLGNFKFSLDRGPAGHRGIVSIIEALGTQAFARLRIGIRVREGKAGDFVLKKVSPRNKAILSSLYKELRENVITNEKSGLTS